MAPLRRLVPESVEWARLEPAGETSVSQFIDSIFNDTPTSAGNTIAAAECSSMPTTCDTSIDVT